MFTAQRVQSKLKLERTHVVIRVDLSASGHSCYVLWSAAKTERQPLIRLVSNWVRGCPVVLLITNHTVWSGTRACRCWPDHQVVVKCAISNHPSSVAVRIMKLRRHSCHHHDFADGRWRCVPRKGISVTVIAGRTAIDSIPLRVRHSTAGETPNAILVIAVPSTAHSAESVTGAVRSRTVKVEGSPVGVDVIRFKALQSMVSAEWTRSDAPRSIFVGWMEWRLNGSQETFIGWKLSVVSVLVDGVVGAGRGASQIIWNFEIFESSCCLKYTILLKS